MSNDSANSIGPSTSFLSKSRVLRISALAAPILGTMLSANLMGLIDTAMIGQLGDTALASVSVGANLFFLVFSLLMGVNVAVQLLVARRMGEGQIDAAPTMLVGGLISAFIASLFVTAASYLVLPASASFINSDEAVVTYARSYLYTVFPSLVFGGCAMAFAGFWLGMQRPILNLITVIIQLVFNALFNYLFIFGHLGLPRLEVAGAGLGTSLANAIALLVNVALVLAIVGPKRLFATRPDKTVYKMLISYSLPMGIQQFLFALGMMVFVFIVGLLGTKPLAAFQIVMVIMMTSIMLAIGLGTTATTLVSGALGKKNVDDAVQWGWEIASLGSGLLLIVGVVFFFNADHIIAIFTKDPSTAQLALIPLRLMIIGIWIEALGRTLSMALVGAGAVGSVFLITFGNQWLLRLPLYWFFGVHLGYGLLGIFISMLVMYIVQTAMFVTIWHRKRWSHISV
ncbi:MATE family efflux transporter [Aurantivibrio plasticivorans]